MLVYFAVAKLGDAPQDGRTDTNPEGLSAATGKHAKAFAARLAGGDLSCKVLDRVQYKKSMLEKLVWIRCSASFSDSVVCCAVFAGLLLMRCCACMFDAKHELGSCCD